MRNPGLRRGHAFPRPGLSARLNDYVTLEARAGEIIACFEHESLSFGKLSPRALERAQGLRSGLPLDSFASSDRTEDQEIDRLVRRLARRGLLEFRLGSLQDGEVQVVIEPQVVDYWPRAPKLGNLDVLVLSRFAYLRRRADKMVLESPRAGALFQICDPKVATALALMSAPQQIKKLRRHDGFPGVELLGLLVDCQIMFKIDPARDRGLRTDEGDDALILWDFHDLLFHARSTEGRHANPLGGRYPFAGVISPLPAIRPRWPGKRIDLRKVAAADSEAISPAAKLLRERHSARSFDDQHPINLAELSRFLDGAARVQSKWRGRPDLGGGGPMVAYAARPYPSAGASYELELYLAVNNCEGLARGFYHYDAGGHALAPIGVRPQELEALLAGAVLATGAPAPPQILIMIAARFGRVTWKYSSLAYALILKNVGVMIQTLYLMATDIGLGGCAIGSANIDLFAKMTGIEFHVEGPVAQFAFGRAKKPEAID